MCDTISDTDIAKKFSTRGDKHAPADLWRSRRPASCPDIDALEDAAVCPDTGGAVNDDRTPVHDGEARTKGVGRNGKPQAGTYTPESEGQNGLDQPGETAFFAVFPVLEPTHGALKPPPVVKDVVRQALFAPEIDSVGLEVGNVVLLAFDHKANLANVPASCRYWPSFQQDGHKRNDVTLTPCRVKKPGLRPVGRDKDDRCNTTRRAAPVSIKYGLDLVIALTGVASSEDCMRFFSRVRIRLA